MNVFILFALLAAGSLAVVIGIVVVMVKMFQKTSGGLSVWEQYPTKRGYALSELDPPQITPPSLKNNEVTFDPLHAVHHLRPYKANAGDGTVHFSYGEFMYNSMGAQGVGMRIVRTPFAFGYSSLTTALPGVLLLDEDISSKVTDSIAPQMLKLGGQTITVAGLEKRKVIVAPGVNLPVDMSMLNNLIPALQANNGISVEITPSGVYFYTLASSVINENAIATFESGCLQIRNAITA